MKLDAINWASLLPELLLRGHIKTTGKPEEFKRGPVFIQMRYLFQVVIFYLSCWPAFGFLFNFNQEPPPPPESYEDRFLNSDCEGYVCPDTLECVSHVRDCPCPFPKSQLKCSLPNNQYVCISKPATHDEKLNSIYDDPVKGPKAKNKGIRDCGWVLRSYKDEI